MSEDKRRCECCSVSIGSDDGLYIRIDFQQLMEILTGKLDILINNSNVECDTKKSARSIRNVTHALSKRRQQ